MKEAPKPYVLTLTRDDIRAIDWSGFRYGWSDYLQCRHVTIGENRFTESESWAFADAVDNDGARFPCLDPNSDLAVKLNSFLDSIV